MKHFECNLENISNAFLQGVDVFTAAYSSETNTGWYMFNEEKNYNNTEHLFVAKFEM